MPPPRSRYGKYRPKTSTRKNLKGFSGHLRRRNKRANARLTICRQLGQTIAPKQKVTLVYAVLKEVDPAAGLAGALIMRANGIFDPEVAAGGTQPRGHSQWEQFYKRYRVTGGKCEVTFMSSSTSTPAAAAVVGIRIVGGLDGNTALPTWKQIVEAQRNQTAYKIIGRADSTRGVMKVTKRFTRKDYDQSANTWKQSYLFSQDPTDVNNRVDYQIFVSPLDTTSPDVANVYLQIKITYHCELTDRVFLADS